MTDEYIHVAGQDGEIYEVRPSDALVRFLQAMADEEAREQERAENRRAASDRSEERARTSAPPSTSARLVAVWYNR